MEACGYALWTPIGRDSVQHAPRAHEKAPPGTKPDGANKLAKSTRYSSIEEPLMG